jgi:deazaflavin-dependent oxidoreductase (nitroreductase family)
MTIASSAAPPRSASVVVYGRSRTAMVVEVMIVNDLVNSPADHQKRPLLGLRKKPGRIALAVFRMPLRAYHHDKGWLLGRTFLELVHTGRKTGRQYEMVAMVLRYDAELHEAVIFAGWGPHTDWVRNLQAGPAVRVTLGRETFVPVHRFLSEDEAFEVVAHFRREHPVRVRLATTILHWGDFRSDATVRDFIPTHPFVAFRPANTRDPSL